MNVVFVIEFCDDLKSHKVFRLTPLFTSFSHVVLPTLYIICPCLVGRRSFIASGGFYFVVISFCNKFCFTGANNGSDVVTTSLVKVAPPAAVRHIFNPPTLILHSNTIARKGWVGDRHRCADFSSASSYFISHFKDHITPHHLILLLPFLILP